MASRSGLARIKHQEIEYHFGFRRKRFRLPSAFLVLQSERKDGGHSKQALPRQLCVEFRCAYFF